MSVKQLLGALSEANQVVTIGMNIAGTVVPLFSGLVKEIKSLGQSVGSEDYQVLIQTDNAQLDTVDQLSGDDLTAINAELAKLGLPIVLSDPKSGNPPSSGPVVDPESAT